MCTNPINYFRVSCFFFCRYSNHRALPDAYSSFSLTEGEGFRCSRTCCQLHGTTRSDHCSLCLLHGKGKQYHPGTQPAPVAVYSNQKLGILHPLSKAEGVCALKELDKGSRENRKDSGTLEEAVNLMTSRAKDLSSVDIEHLQSLLFEYGGVIPLGDEM